MFRYYKKPTTTNTMIKRTTAMAENSKIQSLFDDLVRRLLNSKEDLPCSYRAEVLDSNTIKLRTSGYTLEQTRKILHNGMKG